MVHDVYDAEMWAMIDEEDAKLASFEEDMYEYIQEEKARIQQEKDESLISKTIRKIKNILKRSSL